MAEEMAPDSTLVSTPSPSLPGDTLPSPPPKEAFDPHQNIHLELIQSALKALPSNAKAPKTQLNIAAARIYQVNDAGEIAAQHRREALLHTPGSITTLHNMRVEARKKNELQEIVRWLKAEGSAAISPQRRAKICEESGRILLRSHTFDKALEELNRAALLAPSNAGPHESLRALHATQQHWPQLISTSLRLFEMTKEPARQVALLYLSGVLSEHLVQDDQEAIRCHQRVLEIRPEHRLSFIALERLLRVENRWEELFQATLIHAQQRSKQGEQSPELFALQLGAGHIAWEHLRRPEAAIASFEAAHRLSPRDSRPLAALASLYQRSEGWNALDQTIQRQQSITNDRSVLSSLLLKKAHLQAEHLGRPEQAIGLLETLLLQDPTHPIALELLRTLLLERGQIDALILHLRAAAERTQNLQSKINRYLELAHFCDAHPKQGVAARHAYERTLELDPAQYDALWGLERLLRDSKDFEALASHYSDTLKLTEDPNSQAALLWQLAQLQENILKRPDEAIQSLQSLLELRPEDLSLLWSLQRLYRLLEMWLPLLEAFQKELALSKEPSNSAGLLRRIAQLQEQHLSAPDAAIDALEEALSLVPNDLATHHQRRDLLRKHTRSPQLLNALIELEPLTLPAERPAVLYEIGELQLHLANLPKALETFERSLALDPRFTPALEAIEKVHQEKKDWPQLHDLLSRRAEAALPADQGVLFARLGTLMRQHMGQEKLAEQTFRRALEINPTDPVAQWHLPSILGEQKSWEALSQHLQATLSTPNPTEPAKLMIQQGELLAWRLSEKSEGAALIQKAHDLKGTPENLLQLETLYRILDEPSKVVDSLTKLAASSRDNQASIAMLHEAASICSERMQKGSEEILQRILRRDRLDFFAIERLEALVKSPSQYLELYQRRLEIAEGDESFELRLDIANILCESHPKAALDHLLEALKSSPTHLPTLYQASEIAAKAGVFEVACDLHEKLAATTPDREQRIQNYLVCARHAHQQLSQGDRARNALKAAFDIAPEREDVFMPLSKVLKHQKRWAALARALRSHIDELPLHDLGRLPHLHDLATLWFQRLESPSKSIQTLREYLAIAPTDVGVLVQLAELEKQEGHWEEAAQVYRDALEYEPTSSHSRRWSLHLATILFRSLARPKEAAPVLRELLKSNPKDLEALTLQADLFLQEDHLSQAAKVLLQMLPLHPPKKAAEVRIQLANLARKRGDHNTLREHLIEASKLIMSDFSALSPLLAWAKNPEDQMVVARLLEALLRRTSSPRESLTPISLALATLLSEQLRRHEDAERILGKAIAADPSNIEVLLLASRLYQKSSVARQHALAALKLDPLSLKAYQNLIQREGKRGRQEHVGIAQQSLMMLGSLDAKEAQQGVLLSKHLKYPTSPLDEATWRTFLNISEGPLWAREILRRASFRAQIFQLSAPTLKAVPENHPLLQQTQVIKQQMGIESVEIFIDSQQVESSRHHPEREHCVIFAAHLLRASEAEMRFALAVAFTPILTQDPLPAVLGDRNLVRLIQGLIGLQYKGGNEQELSLQLKSHYLKRRQRKDVLEYLKRQDPREFPFDLQIWRRDERTLALQIGLLLSRDLSASLRMLLREKSSNVCFEGSPKQRAQMLIANPEALSLVRFSNTSAFLNLRSRLNLSLD